MTDADLVATRSAAPVADTVRATTVPASPLSRTFAAYPEPLSAIGTTVLPRRTLTAVAPVTVAVTRTSPAQATDCATRRGR